MWQSRPLRRAEDLNPHALAGHLDEEILKDYTERILADLVGFGLS